MPNRTRIVLSLAVLFAVALIAVPAPPARSQGPSATITPAPGLEPRILYSARDGDRIAYFTMNADGSDKQAAAETFFADDRWYVTIGASISPDGHTLAFGGVDLQGDDPVSDALMETTIHLLDLRTHTVTQLVTQGFSNTSPLWSPDGATIAYMANGTSQHLYAVDVASSESRPLVNNSVLSDVTGMPGLVFGFDWSPDGSQLAAGVVLTDYFEGYVTVVVLNADGSGGYRAMPDERYAFYPAWGPDNNALYYTCSPPESLETEICLIDLATSEITQITHLSDTLTDYYIIDKDVSNDGQIVFEFGLDGSDTSDIYHYYIATGTLTNLTADMEGMVWAPRWIESPPAGP